MITTTCSKVFGEFPFAHRQHNHDGHCALIHGHNWNFKITFAADKLDLNEFVVDFGKLKWIRSWLDSNFDHTLVLNADDPLLEYLKNGLLSKSLAKIVEVPNGGAEGLARWILEQLNAALSGTSAGVPQEWVDRHVRVIAVEVFEDSKNSARVSLEPAEIAKLFHEIIARDVQTGGGEAQA